MKLIYPYVHIYHLISVPLFILFLYECEVSYRTAQRTVEEPHLHSCIFKHTCTHTHLCTVKGCLALGQGISAKDWSWTRELIASQAGQLQSGAREAPPCLPRSKASFSKALFAFCSLQQLNSTQKSLFLPFLCPLFSLFTFSDSAAFWQLIQFLCTKGNYVLNWIIGSFLQMSAHPPTQPQTLNSSLGWAVRYMFPDIAVCRMSMKWKPWQCVTF